MQRVRRDARLTSDGQPFAIDMKVAASTVGVHVSNTAGVSCTGTTENHRGYSYVIPVCCADGRSGTVVANVSADSKRMDGTVQLSDGQQGSFAIDKGA